MALPAEINGESQACHPGSMLLAAGYCQARTFDAKNFKLIVKRFTFAGNSAGR
jgi:hypothetical protein